MTLPAPQTVQDAQLHAMWSEYLGEQLPCEALVAAAGAWPDTQSVALPFRDIERSQPELADYLLERPAHALRLGAAAVAAKVGELWAAGTGALVPRLSLRIYGLPEKLRLPPRHLGVEQIGKLVPVQGLVAAAGKILQAYTEAVWECKVCTTRATVPQEDDELTEPVLCETCEKPSKWRHLVDEGKRHDYCAIRLQDLPDTLNGGQVPEDVTVHLVGDLARCTQPGSRVVVTGFLGSKFLRTHGRRSNLAQPVLHAIHVEEDASQVVDLEVAPEESALFERLAARPDVHHELMRCVSPSTLGLEGPRLSCLYALAGAPDIMNSDGSVRRGRIHVLIAGEPGVAKSMVLRSLRNYVPRCVEVNGIDANKTGLGAGIAKDGPDGEWMVEAGALVLAHLGYLFFDEFGLLEDEHRGVMNSSMEEGRILLTKIRKGELAAKATVIAVMNPVFHRFDRHQPYLEQLGMSHALRSRFDLTWCVLDVVDRARDNALADHKRKSEARGVDVREHFDIALNADQLRRYLNEARKLNPTISDGAHAMLKAF